MAFATRKEMAALEARIAVLEEQLTVGLPAPSIENVLTLHEVFGDDIAAILSEGGYSSVASVKASNDETLRAVPGIGPARLKDIRRLSE